MEITEWIAKLNEWDGHVHDDDRDTQAHRNMNIALAKQAVSKAEERWNAANANSGVVEKVLTGDDLKAAIGGEIVQAFVDYATTVPQE